MKTFAVGALCSLWIGAGLWAQTISTSQISGIVQDSSGLAVQDAQVVLANTETGGARTTTSGQNGIYVIQDLGAGSYQLRVSKEGFNAYVQSGIVLQVGVNPQINARLTVGSVTQEVVVQADAAMVETHTNGVGSVIDQQRVIDLPLNGRNVTQLITLSGAAVLNTGGGLASNLNYPTVAAFSIAGGQNNATNYFLDGGTHIDPRTNVGLPLPFPDALQEFKVETSTLPANYGNHPGGAVNAVTMSGTNALHGDAFYFLRNYVFNARNAFATARDSLKRNQFGGVVGGRIVKDKLFFFAGFQGTTERTAPATNISYVPTAAVLQGNFQAILAPPCQTRQVNLPASIATNNIIPASLINPVAIKYAALLPVSTDPCGRIQYGVPSSDNEYQGVTRVDWQRTTRDSLFARYFVTDYNLKPFYDKSNLLTAGTVGLLDRVQSVILGDTFLINSRTVSSARLSYSRSAVQRVDADGIPTLTQLGSNVVSPIPNYTGQFSASGYFSSGAIPGWVYTNIITPSEDIGMTLGSHQLGFGFNWIHTQMNANGPFQENPRMTFNGQATGNALADFMTGNLDTMLQGGGQIGRDGQNAPSLYIQDNWKLSQQCQINTGLRWDPFLPQHDKYGYNSQFSVPGFYAGKMSQVYANAPPGLTFPGDPGYPDHSDTAARYWDFAPRFGIVYDPRGKGQETIRAGYGIFYDSSYLWNTLHIPLNPPWGETITLNSPPGGLSNPWQGYPGGDPFPPPSKFPSNFQFPQGGTYVFEPADSRATYLQQWNVSFQKQLTPAWMVSATYLGNKTSHQWLGYEQNPAVYIPGNCLAGQYGLTAAGPCSTTGNTNARRVFTLFNPVTGGYYGGAAVTDTNGDASYNGLLLSAQHRFSQGFSAHANYTWSHCLDQGEAGQDIGNMYQDPKNRRAEWSNCASDHRQIVNISIIARTPKFASPWVERLAGNWQLSVIDTYSTGSWVTVTDGTDISLTGLGADRPNVAGDWHVSNQSYKEWFNPAAFVKQPTGTFGNAGKALILGPGRFNVDAALWRTFPIKERTKLDLRWEAFNVLNNVQLGNPGAALNNGNTLGQITSAQNPRIMQVALKLTF